MNYSQAVQYLYDSAPLFQNIGAAAYKEGLGNTLVLDAHFSHPHRKYRTIHVGGTNGKGSVSHTLAAILQAQGYRVGLYTSPHLVDFRERIRINGKPISQQRIVEFVEQECYLFDTLHPSFFELVTALAFQYFAEQQVDFAVIEVGLGGRIDCTNIIQPELSIITNISFDHVQFLGNTLPKIASEKAGIIKPDTPVCIGENISAEVKTVFSQKAHEVGAPIIFAEDEGEILQCTTNNCTMNYETKHFGTLQGALAGLCQEKNTATILTSVLLLRKCGINISDEAVKKGMEEVTTMTGLMGRWQIIGHNPLTICDTAHNKGGLSYIFRHLSTLPHRRLHLIFGMVSDKDVDGVLTMLYSLIPKPYSIYFTQASVGRAMPVEEICKRASSHNLYGTAYSNVAFAYAAAQENASADDIIYIGGSTFVVADMLKSIL